MYWVCAPRGRNPRLQAVARVGLYAGESDRCGGVSQRAVASAGLPGARQRTEAGRRGRKCGGRHQQWTEHRRAATSFAPANSGTMRKRWGKSSAVYPSSPPDCLCTLFLCLLDEAKRGARHLRLPLDGFLLGGVQEASQRRPFLRANAKGRPLGGAQAVFGGGLAAGERPRTSTLGSSNTHHQHGQRHRVRPPPLHIAWIKLGDESRETIHIREHGTGRQVGCGLHRGAGNLPCLSSAGNLPCESSAKNNSR
eukprot:266290-Prymnesium_polylepis.2